MPGSKAVTHAEACKESQIIVLCTPGGQATLDCFTTLYKAALLSGEITRTWLNKAITSIEDKIVIDLTNPFALDHAKSTSGGEMLQNIAPTVRVVKTLNSIGHNKYGSPAVHGEKVDMFVAGDNAEARKVVLELVGELGFNPVDAGGIAASRWIEALCYGWVHMAHTMGWGRDIGWKLIK